MKNEEALYQQWTMSHDKGLMAEMVKELEPAISMAVSKWSGGIIPDEQLKVKAKLLTVEAIKDYKPGMGTALFTHVTNYLKKLSRDVYTSDVIYNPEQQVIDYARYIGIKNTIEDDFGAPPTLDDLQAKTGWSQKKLLTMERNFNKKYNENFVKTKEYAELNHIDEDDLLYAYNNLSEEDQQLFTMKTGWPHGKAYGIEEIARKKGYSVGFLSNKYKEIAVQVQRILKR